MSVQLAPLRPDFVAEVSGLDLAQPIDAATVAALWSAIDQHAVLIFRDQGLTDAQLRDFATRFGPLEIGRAAAHPGPRRIEIPQIGDISNLDINNNVRALHDRRRLGGLSFIGFGTSQGSDDGRRRNTRLFGSEHHAEV